MIRREPTLTLREARLLMAHSQESLAEAARVNRRTIASIELSQHIPKPITKRKLARVLHCHPWQLRWPEER